MAPRRVAGAREDEGRLLGLGRALLALLLPPLCAACGGTLWTDAEPLCAGCRARLPRGEPEPGPAPRLLRQVVVAVPLAGGWETWIHRFKYPAPGLRGMDPAAQAVVLALAREAAARVAGPPPDAVVPLALHPARVRARGFHPPALLARAVARARGAPLRHDLLRRTRDTPSQTGLARGARRRNVRDAFRAGPGVPRHVWLVDDVVTTGATLEAAARALRRAGAREIDGVCVARTLAPPG